MVVEVCVDVHLSLNSNFNQINDIQLACQAKFEQKIQLNLNSCWFFSFKAEFVELGPFGSPKLLLSHQLTPSYVFLWFGHYGKKSCFINFAESVLILILARTSYAAAIIGMFRESSAIGY